MLPGRHAFAVGAIGCHRIVSIRYSDHTSPQWYLIGAPIIIILKCVRKIHVVGYNNWTTSFSTDPTQERI